jgi:hypothetical protein
MNGRDLDLAMQQLEADGAVRGVDFVPTASGHGIIGPHPDWLVMELSETGNPPEVEAKMTREVYDMWQNTRRKIYRTARSCAGRCRGLGEAVRRTAGRAQSRPIPV